MIGRRDKQRIKIYYLHTKILEIIQFLHYPGKIPAVKFSNPKICRTFIPIFHLLTIYFNIIIFIGLYIIGRITITKPIHQNLIHHSSLCPIWRRKPWNNRKCIFLTHLRRHSHAVIITVKHSCSKLKMIVIRLCAKLHLCPIVIKYCICLLLLHRNLPIITAQPYNIHIILRGTECKRHLFIDLRLRWIPVVFRSIRK